MGKEWYDIIAKRNGGYKSDAVYIVEGFSGEDVFVEELTELLKKSESTLDAGCGHGDFTIKMAQHAQNIIGFDWSEDLLKIANSLKEHYKAENVSFVRATTKAEMPFDDGQFDLIYCRRGPTSIANHSRILRKSGLIYGICPGAPDIVNIVLEKLKNNGFVNNETSIYDNAILVFPNEIEFAKFLRDFPGNPDYTLPEMKQELEEKAKENTIDGRICFNQWRFIWKATKA